MNEHTPGPWTADPEGEHAVEIEGATGTVVCTVYQPANAAPDARLITAAPDLLGMLEEVLYWCEQDAENEDEHPTQEMLDNRVDALRTVIGIVREPEEAS